MSNASTFDLADQLAFKTAPPQASSSPTATSSLNTSHSLPANSSITTDRPSPLYTSPYDSTYTAEPLTLSHPINTKPPVTNNAPPRPEFDLQKYQDQLTLAKNIMMETFQTPTALSSNANPIHLELDKMSEYLANERAHNSKLSAELSKSMELNLKLQFEIEDLRSKTNQLLREEKTYSESIKDKQKKTEQDLELLQALNADLKSELYRTKQAFQGESEDFKKTIDDLQMQVTQHQKTNEFLESAIAELESEKDQLNQSLTELKKHTDEQSQVLGTMSEMAQEKVKEIQLALHQKSAEARDYQSHLQQALTQLEIFKQENKTLRDYFTKLSTVTQNLL